MRALIELALQEEGHRTTAVADGPAALDLVALSAFRPDLLLLDYNLPNGMDGGQVAVALRKELRRPVPAVILTGDISTVTLQDIAAQDAVPLKKPVKLDELSLAIQRLLPAP